MASDVWMMILTTIGGNDHRLCGPREVLEGYKVEWLDWMEAASTRKEDAVLRAAGVTDSADQAEIEVCTAMNQIASITTLMQYRAVRPSVSEGAK